MEILKDHPDQGCFLVHGERGRPAVSRKRIRPHFDPLADEHRRAIDDVADACGIAPVQQRRTRRMRERRRVASNWARRGSAFYLDAPMMRSEYLASSRVESDGLAAGIRFHRRARSPGQFPVAGSALQRWMLMPSPSNHCPSNATRAVQHNDLPVHAFMIDRTRPRWRASIRWELN